MTNHKKPYFIDEVWKPSVFITYAGVLIGGIVVAILDVPEWVYISYGLVSVILLRNVSTEILFRTTFIKPHHLNKQIIDQEENNREEDNVER